MSECINSFNTRFCKNFYSFYCEHQSCNCKKTVYSTFRLPVVSYLKKAKETSNMKMIYEQGIMHAFIPHSNGRVDRTTCPELKKHKKRLITRTNVFFNLRNPNGLNECSDWGYNFALLHTLFSPPPCFPLNQTFWMNFGLLLNTNDSFSFSLVKYISFSIENISSNLG